jgi:hypothetical protein
MNHCAQPVTKTLPRRIAVKLEFAMFQKERIEQLMADVGPMADLCAVEYYPSESVWHIAVDEETAVYADLAPSRGVMVLSAEVGKPAAGDLKPLYELFLRYAHVWDANDGLRMSLDAPDGDIWLSFDCAAQDMTAAELGRTLTAFAGKVKAWREIVAAHGHAPAEPHRLEALLDSGSVRA